MLAAFCISGCGSEPTVCTAEPQFAVVVKVRDAATGEPAALGATLVIREGQYADSATGTYTGADQEFAAFIGAAVERPGTYDVTVRKTGYQTWTRQQIAVGIERCGVSTVELPVMLVRTSPYVVPVARYLLVQSKRSRGIDAYSAPSWNPGSKRRNDRQDRDSHREQTRIAGGRVIEHRRQDLAHRPEQEQPNRRSRRHDEEGTTHDA